MEKAVFYGFDSVTMRDDFFLHYRNKIAQEIIFEQWDILCDTKAAAYGHAVVNFEICAGIKKGEFKGLVFQDSDLYKWLEAAGNILAKDKNEKLLCLVEYCTMLFEKTQQPDGYMNTYFTLVRPDKKFKNLTDSHELYCAGHFFEAVVSVYKAIKSERLLTIAKKMANLLIQTFGDEPEKLRTADGHEEIELALIKLYELTSDERYFVLAKFFIDTRGSEPNYFKIETENNKGANIWSGWLEKEGRIDEGALVYMQANKKLEKQTVAAGHAVRVTYLMIALAALSRDNNDIYNKTVKAIWKNIVNTQMYITGGVGQTNIGEAFTTSYDLPNTTAYCETCASIGMALTAKKLLENEQNGEYAAILSKELYNGIIAGISYDCSKYFYVNPLEVNSVREDMVGLAYVKQNRQAWHGCACCPPNLSRFLTSVETCIFSKKQKTIFINQIIASKLNSSGDIIDVKVVRGQNFSSKINILSATNFDTIAIFIPAYLENYIIKVNNNETKKNITNSFAYIDVKGGDIIELTGFVRAKFIRCNTKVNYNAGKVCVMFGDLVMCAEQVDNGENLHNIVIDANSSLEVIEGDVLKIKASGSKYVNNNTELYYEDNNPQKIAQDIIFTPYYFWNNRSSGEMMVWISMEYA